MIHSFSTTIRVRLSVVAIKTGNHSYAIAEPTKSLMVPYSQHACRPSHPVLQTHPFAPLFVFFFHLV